jgi:hypothetical protein
VHRSVHVQLERQPESELVVEVELDDVVGPDEVLAAPGTRADQVSTGRRSAD